jgi:hypothetical protein
MEGHCKVRATDTRDTRCGGAIPEAPPTFVVAGFGCCIAEASPGCVAAWRNLGFSSSRASNNVFQRCLRQLWRAHCPFRSGCDYQVLRGRTSPLLILLVLPRRWSEHIAVVGRRFDWRPETSKHLVVVVHSELGGQMWCWLG